MIGATPHLDEERLFDCYLAVRAGQTPDPAAGEHLGDCEPCATRYAELMRFMDAVRADGDADLDTLFPADRLQRQRQEIARRIEAIGRSARVISFPRQAPARRLTSTDRRLFPRWVAATAAAGLFAGVATGLFFDRTDQPRGVRVESSEAQAVSTTPAPLPSLVPGGGADPDHDARFMTELEMVADRPQTAELAAYDELTPHIREISFLVPGR